MKRYRSYLCWKAWVITLGLGIFQTGVVLANSDGKDGASGANGSDCTTCHTAGAAVPTVTLEGPATAAANSVNTYKLTITGGPAIAAGLGVSATGGTLAVSGPDTQLMNGEIVQSAPVNFTNGTASFTFDWQSPAANGSYTINAAGFSGDGNGILGDGTATTTLTVNVGSGANQGPTAVIAGPANAAAGVAVTFDGAGSTPSGGIATYDWNFGHNNAAGSGATVTHTFPAGTYTVTLTVTDAAGATNSATTSITVAAAGTPLPPTADAGGPYTGTVGTSITFDGSGSTDADGTLTSYSWTFGDAAAGTGTGVAPTYTYTAAGSYTVNLTVTDNSGATAQAQAAVTITAAGTTPPGGGGGTIPPGGGGGTTPPGGGGGTPAPGAADGQALYDANCASCHGPGGTGGPDGPVVGASAQLTTNAIATVPTMQSLSTLTTAEIQAITDYLVIPAGSGGPGETLYNTNCAACHGVNGVGGPDGSVVGESAADTAEAIIEYPEMAFLGPLLSEADLQLIADFLAGPEVEDDAIDSPTTIMSSDTLYEVKCAACHGKEGKGGTKEGPIFGASVSAITRAVGIEEEMAFLKAEISANDIEAISAYLKRVNGTSTNVPATTAPINTVSPASNAENSGGGGVLNWLTIFGMTIGLILRRGKLAKR